MFERRRHRTAMSGAFGLLELTFHATTRNLRKTHGNAILGLLASVAQSLVMLGAFYLMFDILGMRRLAIRGDFLLYLMSGIFLYMTHTKAMAAVFGSEGPTSAMMKHAPMNTLVSIAAAALSALYTQVLSMLVVLCAYHTAISPITIDKPVGAFGMLLMAWFSGVAIGMLALAAKPWSPGTVGLIVQIYSRANMIASGKMFVANMMPTSVLALFWWNPLFHTIDQARGFVFLNYTPHYSSLMYPIYVALALIMIGLMGEFYTRQRASLSWHAGR